ncbi:MULTISPECIES: ABC transporter permease [Micromonospora]|uniref:Transport permease protein n=1 Tax=Micromonospora rifamycinica TaxID=291594 RepID=A0A120FA52_9ACTN|nr:MULTISPECIES: ABC transporter permease [Micromonospora]KWV34402.1 ABC transporter [Micromonospora rifamycinica]WFE63020.1 ABC transporter permease [Micromonospora sp. WMMD714]SCG74185.1 lipooligosaccharide transport system permease protein [Micromonospora rifamycinica]
MTTTQTRRPGLPHQRRGALRRMLPVDEYAGLARVIVERSARLYLRAWAVLISGVVEPLFYLLAVTVGFRSLVPTVTLADGSTVPYVDFVAPALLAASAMNGAISETLSIYFKLRYDKLYEAMLTTPVGPLDIVLGEVGWAVLRGGFYGTVFLGVLAALGLVTTPWAVVLVPVGLLVSFAFAAVGMAWATTLRSNAQLDYVTLASTAMFLFSTTFFPLSSYPAAVQWLVQLSPLYHGVELARMFFLGTPAPAALLHTAYLVVLALGGLTLARVRLRSMFLG